MISILFFALVLSLSDSSDISDIFRRGFGLDHGALKSSPDLKRGKVPQHLQDLLNATPKTDSNRYISKSVTSMKASKRKVAVSYNLRTEKNHGVLKDAELVIYLKTLSEEITLIVTIFGSNHLYKISSKTGGPIALSLKTAEEISYLTSLNIEITATHNFLSSHGIEVTSALELSKILNLRERPQLVLHYKNEAIVQASAGVARRQFMDMFGETTHHLHRRSSTSSHCQVRDLIVNFSNIGLNSVIAPVQFNAHKCSGQCHLDHKETPMTNHAFIQNLMLYNGDKNLGAMCVSDKTAPLTVLVAVGEEFHLTVYEDMIVESCSCR